MPMGVTRQRLIALPPKVQWNIVEITSLSVIFLDRLPVLCVPRWLIMVLQVEKRSIAPNIEHLRISTKKTNDVTKLGVPTDGYFEISIVRAIYLFILPWPLGRRIVVAHPVASCSILPGADTVPFIDQSHQPLRKRKEEEAYVVSVIGEPSMALEVEVFSTVRITVNLGISPEQTNVVMKEHVV